MTQQLKLEINNLTRLVEAGAGLSIGEEATMNEMLQQKEELTKERDAQVCGVGFIGWRSGVYASRPCILLSSIHVKAELASEIVGLGCSRKGC